jgi:transposase-like protein
MEAYVHGTSTRKVDDLVRALGVDSGISKSEVSRICAELDGNVTVFRSRSLSHTVFPYLFVERPTSRPAWMAGWSAALW